MRGIKVKLIRLRNSLYILIPIEVARLTGITGQTRFMLNLHRDGEYALQYRKLEEEAGGRILLVDDDESIRSVLVAILEEAGYVVDTAENGGEALVKSNNNFYNLALIDIRLPDMDGTELLTAIKETTPKMVKIIITGYPSMETAIRAVDRNADAYVPKPFTIEKLLDTIREHLKKQRDSGV